MSRVRTLAVVLAASVVAALLAPDAAVADPPAPPGTPTASTLTTPDRTVGPIFRDGLSADHECTASVIASPTHDLILTAAHCITGTAAGYQFAPGYAAGATPYGVWTVVHAYVDPSWLSVQDTRHDYAILQVAHIGGRGVQDVTGANVLAPAPPAGARITDTAYNAGSGDLPVSCTVPTYRTQGFPTFNCHGYVGGSSGSPWLLRVPGTHLTLVTGLIGGLHQGGCYEYTSYSSPFTVDVYKLLARAVLRVRPDTVPAAGRDGC